MIQLPNTQAFLSRSFMAAKANAAFQKENKKTKKKKIRLGKKIFRVKKTAYVLDIHRSRIRNQSASPPKFFIAAKASGVPSYRKLDTALFPWIQRTNVESAGVASFFFVEDGIYSILLLLSGPLNPSKHDRAVKNTRWRYSQQERSALSKILLPSYPPFLLSFDML